MNERSLVHGLFRCPACGAGAFEGVTVAFDVNLRCVTCGACWHVELGYISRIDPRTCGSCRHRPACLALTDAKS
jgi:hypothetical protein